MDAAQIIADPAWLPHRLATDGSGVAFRHTPREAHRAATFLDDASLGPGETVSLALGSDITAGAPPPGALHFIFHSAFCCSTLLARLFDLPGISMGLKEPEVLNDLAHAHRTRGDVSLLPNVLALLARPFEGDAAIIVKPSNVANNLIEPILTLRPDARGILLYAPLRTFLISVAKKGLWGRIWVRKLYSLLQLAPGFSPGFTDRDLFEQSDLQIAALGWLQQQAQFAALLRRHAARIVTIDSETLLAQRDAIAPPLGAHFGLPLSDGALDPALFEEHSKRLGQRYDPAQRAAETARNAEAHDEEISMVERWATAIAEQFAIPLRLGQPLL